MSMSGQNQTSTPCSPPTPTDTLDADPELSMANDINLSIGSEATAAQKKRFPRFLVIEDVNPNKTLRRANGTILDKTIDGATSVTTKRGWMGKAVLVEVNCGAYSKNLLKLTQIGDMPIRVSAHQSLNYAKGVVRFRQAAQDLTKEDLARDLNMSRRNRDQPQVKDASRVTITKGGKKVQTGTFFLTFDAPTLPEHIFLGFERFDVEKYIPLPRRCFKCQQFGHGARTCQATEDICPLCSGTHKQDDCPNKESPKCPNCDGAHPATSRECPAFLTEKRALEIQVGRGCTLPAAREQAGQTASAEVAVNSYAQALANSQADLVNHNLALSDENARLREVITTLRQDNAYLKQRLDGYEQRLKTLEQIVPHKHQVSRKIFSLILICFLFVVLLGTYENHVLKLHRWYLWSVASKTSLGEGDFTGNTKINIICCHELRNQTTMSKFCTKHLHQLGNHNKST